MSKTGQGLAKWAEDIFAGGKHVYWYGTYCNPCTTSLLKGKTNQYPAHYKDARQATYKKHIDQGKTCTDCVGLIKGYYWELNGAIKYRRNDLPDKGANGMYGATKIKGTIANGLPEIPGILVWTKDKGHVGVYVGEGMVVEARGFSYGVQRNALKDRAFVHWGLCPYITYTADEETLAIETAGIKSTGNTTQDAQKPAQVTVKVQGGVNMPTLRKGNKGLAVKVLQRFLKARGAKLEKYGCDADFGAETLEAVKAFQTSHNLTADGICGPLTWAALVG